LSREETRLTPSEYLQLLMFAYRPALGDQLPPGPLLPSDTVCTGRQLLEALMPPILFYQHGGVCASATLLFISLGPNLRIVDGCIEGPGCMDARVVGSGHRSLIAHLCRYFELHHTERLLRQWQRVGCKFLEMRGTSIGLRDMDQLPVSIDDQLRFITRNARSRNDWNEQAEALWVRESRKAKPTPIDHMVHSRELKGLARPCDACSFFSLFAGGAKGSLATLRAFRCFIGLQPVHESATVPIVDFIGVQGWHPYNDGVVDCSLTHGKNEYAHFIEAQKHRDELRRGAKSTPEAGYKQRQVGHGCPHRPLLIFHSGRGHGRICDLAF